MISCFLLVPALVPGLVSLLVSLLVFSFFAQKRSLFHHEFLLLAGSDPGSVACLPSCLASCFFFLCSKGGCSGSSRFFLFQERGSVPSWCAGSSWFRLGFRCLSPFLLSSFFSPERGFVPSWCPGSSWFRHVPALVPVTWSLFHHGPDYSGSGSGASLPSSFFLLFFGKGFSSIMMSWFLLVPARVQVLVSLLLSFLFSPEWRSVPPWFPGSWWFRLWCRCLSPFFFLLSFLRKWCSVSWFRLGFRCLSPFFSLLSFLRKGVLFHHDLLVAPGSGSGSGGCLPFFSLLSFFRKPGSVPSWFPGSFWFRFWFRCLSPLFLLSGREFCSILISWFLLFPVRVPVLMSLLLPSFHFLRKTVLFRHDCMVLFLLRLLVFLFRFHLWRMNFDMSHEWR